jgi:hypothetical protein
MIGSVFSNPASFAYYPSWLRGLHQRIFTGIASCGAMKLLSVNVGLPREVEWKGKIVRTSIFKAPVLGRVPVAKLNLDGDQQSDLSVHGGIDKAVYAYPSEHYPFWRQQLPDMDLPWELSARTSQRRACLRKPLTLAIAFGSGPRNLLSLNLECPVSNSASASVARIS